MRPISVGRPNTSLGLTVRHAGVTLIHGVVMTHCALAACGCRELPLELSLELVLVARGVGEQALMLQQLQEVQHLEQQAMHDGGIVDRTVVAPPVTSRQDSSRGWAWAWARACTSLIHERW